MRTRPTCFAGLLLLTAVVLTLPAAAGDCACSDDPPFTVLPARDAPRPADLDDLTTILRSGDESARILAAEDIGRLAPPGAAAVPALIDALDDPSCAVAAAASGALRVLAPAAAVQPLRERLDSPDCRRREAAAQALSAYRTAGIAEDLITALADPDRRVRAAAASSLGRLGDQRAVEPLSRSLGDPSKHVRQHAAASLGQLRDARAREALSVALDDPSKHVRETAAEALSRLPDADPTPEDPGLCTPAWLAGFAVRAPGWSTEEALRRLDHRDPKLRVEAVAALAAGGDDGAVEPLIRSLEQDGTAQVRAAAADALGRLGDRRAVPALLAAVRDAAPVTRQMAVRALGRLADPRAAEPLTDLLAAAAGKTLRQEAAWALGNVPGADAAGLVEALSDPSFHVRRAAACSLGKLGRPSSRAPLRAAADDEEPFVRAAANWALQRLATGG